MRKWAGLAGRQWLPHRLHPWARYMEAEGMEKTYKFKQEDIADAVPLASSLQVHV